MSGRCRGFRRDDRGVSEVVGYLLTFGMSALLLAATMFTFNIVSEQGRRAAAEAEFRDVANRVAGGVLEVFRVGSTIEQTNGTIDSGTGGTMRYTKVIDIPPEFRGISYTITVDETAVRVVSTDGFVDVSASTLKAEVVLAPPGSCTPDFAVCELGGFVPQGSPTATITYEFKPPEVEPDLMTTYNRIIVSR